MKLHEAKVGDWVKLLDSDKNDIIWVKEFDYDNFTDKNFIQCSDLKGKITEYHMNCEIEVIENYTADGMS